jgi:hypothetical protein
MKLAIYSTFCGITDRITWKPTPLDSRFPHYFIANDPDVFTVTRSFGWKDIYMNAPITSDATFCAQQAKVPKAMPHIFPELMQYDYLLYVDDKLKLNLNYLNQINKIEETIEAMEVMNIPIGMRLHPHSPKIDGKYNVLFEMIECMYQWRYRREWERTVKFVNSQVKLGKTLETKKYFATGLILRNMKHPDMQKINETWYDYIQQCGPQCQISFHFVAQEFKNLKILPKNMASW